jgi:Glycine rich protein
MVFMNAGSALRLRWSGLALAISLCGLWALLPPIARGETTSFASTGAEQTFTVPAGVTSIHVVAVGAAGGNFAFTTGGLGAEASADIAVTPGEALYLEVGGAGGNGNSNGTAPAGGFNGGGAGGGLEGGGEGSGAAGGGASDVRTITRGQSGSLGSRLIVAAGGGGASYAEKGGSAGEAGEGPYPGQPGTATAGGLPNGELGVGGAGGTDHSGNGGGGGGGGGLYGGGGGLNGAGLSYAASGGGGGSSGFGTGTTNTTVVGKAMGAASITLTYTPSAVSPPGSVGSAPITKLLAAKINAKKHTASFKFGASGQSTGFQCALLSKKHKKPKFTSCRSPKTYKRLKPGKYTFEVRAVGPGGTDSTPAKKTFKLK